MKGAKINITYHSGIFKLETWQILESGIDEAWDFFSDPSKLAEITPPHMGFLITSGKPSRMYQGQIISYRIGILPLIKSNWVTEITTVVPGKYFIDEQRSGPYRIWHHEHHFTHTDKVVEMHDKVTYKIPLGPLGRMVHFLYIRKKLLNIFTYRYNKLDEIFNSKK
ncbi:MAG: SRPBCC family protein [Bacteroidales bacterium]|nr:SRPBCC family protein [Bacteroidales bacterium]